MNMNKKIKGIIAIAMAGVMAFTGASLSNVVKSHADEVTKYERANHLSVDDNGELVIKRNKLGNTPMGKKDAWTIFVYMCGSDLESGGCAATDDIKEMIDAKYNENVNIVIQTGGASEWNGYNIESDKIGRYVVKEDDLERVDSLPNASMGDADTLENFIKWGVKNYAAEHMGVIYWNHGGGSIYGACSDENYYGMLTLSEFEKAMSNATKDMTDKFDFVGFDACLMATLETANTFVPFADYLIASEESESSCGWYYTPFVELLASNPDTDVVTLGKTIIDNFLQENINNGTEDIATLSMTDLSKIDEILVNFNKVAKKMDELSKTPEDINLFTKLAYAAENYSEGAGFDLIDFTDYMLNIVDLIPEAEDVAKLMEDAIVYEKHGEIFLDTKGLSFYYCYGSLDMPYLNILRNISVSPYLLNFIEKIIYGGLHNGSLDGFVSNKWEENKDYYYDKTYDFVEFEYETDDEYNEKRNNPYFAKATFDEVWKAWYESVFNGGLEVETSEYSENEAEESDIEKAAKANYRLAVNKGTSKVVIGDLGSVEENEQYDNVWFTLDNGSLISAKKLNEGNGLTMYRAEVLLDNEETYVLFVKDKKNNVLVIGTWSGMDKGNKSAGRIMSGIAQGHTITPVYSVIDTNTGKITKEYGQASVSNSRVIKAITLTDADVLVETTDAFGFKAYTQSSKY